jgi:hypothetical protein
MAAALVGCAAARHCGFAANLFTLASSSVPGSQSARYSALAAWPVQWHEALYGVPV